MYSKTEKEAILKKIEQNRGKYEMIGDYETHKPIICMFTDKPVVHEYHEKSNEESHLNGWAVDVKLSNGECIICIASHYSYDESDINNDDEFVVE